MDNDINEGLCVGGPLDGRRVECKGPAMHAAQTVSLGEANFEQTERTADLAVPVVTYTIRRVDVGLEEVSLWVPEEKGLDEAMAALISTYHAVGGAV